MNFNDIVRTFHPNAEEYTFFSNAHGTFSRIDHILGHKSSLRKFKKIEIVSSIFSNYNNIRLREGNGTPLQYSCLENPTDRGAW